MSAASIGSGCARLPARRRFFSVGVLGFRRLAEPGPGRYSSRVPPQGGISGDSSVVVHLRNHGLVGRCQTIQPLRSMSGRPDSDSAIYSASCRPAASSDT